MQKYFCQCREVSLLRAAPRLRGSLLPALLLGAACLPGEAQAQPDWLQVTLENDLFADEDDGYTNGASLGWGYRNLPSFNSDVLPGWIAFLAGHTYLGNMPDRQHAVSYSLAQAMYTPEQIGWQRLIPDDRPYAGLLLWSGSLYAFDVRRADRLSLTLGAVGPIAGAKHTQKFMHRLSGAVEPRGWHNQLHNEPVFAIDAQRLWRLAEWRLGSLETDAVAGGSVRAGNLISGVETGITMRIGSRLRSTWSGVSLIPSRTLNTFALEQLPSWQLYVSLGGQYVLNDITLNGNTFRDSHSVPLEHLRGMVSTGLALNRGAWGASLSYQIGTDQFEGQTTETRFGSLTVTYLF